MTKAPPSPVMETIRRELPGTVRNELMGGWIVPFDAPLVQVVMRSRQALGLPPLVDVTRTDDGE